MDLIDLARPWLLALVLTLPRITVAFLLMPIFVEPMIPGMIRNGIMIALASFLLPLTHEQVLMLDPTAYKIIPIIIKEAILGLFIGFTFSIPFWAVRATGFLIDTQRGAMSSVFFSQLSGSMTSPIGNLLAQMTVVLLFISGGFLMLLEAIYLSYQTWPIHQFMPAFNANSISFFLKEADLLLYTIVLMAGPFIGIMLLIDIGAGLIGRYLPQLNVFLIAMPVKSGLAFFLLIFYVVIIGHYLRNSFVKFGSYTQLLDGLLR